MHANHSLEKWILSARQGNQRAQYMLFETYGRRCKRLCLRYLKKDEDAKDAMQDGFVKLFSSLQTFEFQSEQGWFVYLKKTMITACLMKVRNRKIYLMEQESEIPDTPADPIVFEKFTAAEIDRLLLKIPACHAIVFNLVVLEGYDHKSIAEMLEITEYASRARLMKARQWLQKLLSSKENYDAANSK